MIGRVSTVSVLTDNGGFVFDLKMVMLMMLHQTLTDFNYRNLVDLKPAEPVLWPPAVMCNSQDLKLKLFFSVNKREGETV